MNLTLGEVSVGRTRITGRCRIAGSELTDRALTGSTTWLGLVVGAPATGPGQGPDRLCRPYQPMRQLHIGQSLSGDQMLH